jgi:hypothetical protein
VDSECFSLQAHKWTSESYIEGGGRGCLSEDIVVAPLPQVPAAEHNEDEEASSTMSHLLSSLVDLGHATLWKW